MFYKKDLIISILIAAVVAYFLFSCGIDEIPVVPLAIGILSVVICSFVWDEKYDKYDREADIYGIGFSKRKLPRFIKGQEKMNIFAFNVYLYLLLLVLFPIFKYISIFSQFSE